MYHSSRDGGLCFGCDCISAAIVIHRYAFSEDVGEDGDEEATVALTAQASIPDPTKEKNPVNTDVFSLDDDVEEGKLE